jgi:hypothetical protein
VAEAPKKKTGKFSPKEIRTRFDRADKKWQESRAILDLCYTYACPQRNLFDGSYEGGVQGAGKMNQVFDSTAISSLDRFANRIQSNVFPPQGEWCRQETGTDIPEGAREKTQKVLEAFNKRMFAVMRASNFDIAMGEFLHDIGIGTAHMVVQPGDAVNPVNYSAIPPYLVRFEEDEFGRPCNHYRKMKIKAELITTLWRGADLDQDMQTAERDKPAEELELLEATIKDRDTGRYHYHVLYKDHEVFYKNRKFTNWLTARYSKLAGETMGRGPVISALPDIRTLNKVKELVLKNAALAVSGVWTGRDDGVLNPNNVKITPGTVIAVAANAGAQGPSLQALKSAADFNVAQLVINDLVMSVKRILLDESLPPDTASARSATEIIQRMKELAQNLGSAFGRLIDEVMIPLVEITMYVLDEAGVVDFPLRINGREVKVTPVAPLAMAQHMDEVETILNYAQMMAQIFGPEGQVALNESTAIDYLGDRMGVPLAIRRNATERATKVEELTAQLAAAAKAAGAAAQAQQSAPEGASAPMPMAA